VRVSAVPNRRKGKKDARCSEGKGWEIGRGETAARGIRIATLKRIFWESVLVRITQTFLGWGSLLGTEYHTVGFHK